MHADVEVGVIQTASLTTDNTYCTGVKFFDL